MQHRQVLCRQVYANRSLAVQPYRCQHLEKPETTSTCQLKICSEWQIRTDWTSVQGLRLSPTAPTRMRDPWEGWGMFANTARTNSSVEFGLCAWPVSRLVGLVPADSTCPKPPMRQKKVSNYNRASPCQC